MKNKGTKVSRSAFLHWTLGGAGTCMFGCSDAAPMMPAGQAGTSFGGAFNMMGTGGTAGMSTAMGGAAGGFAQPPMAGSGGAPVMNQGGMPGANGGTPGVAGQQNAAGMSTGGMDTGTGGTSMGGTGMGGDGAGGAGVDPCVIQSSDEAPDCNMVLNVTITANHGHTLEIPVADIMAAQPKSYNGQGDSPHVHWMQFTTADFMALQSGLTVVKVTCNDGHEHQYIVSCTTAEHVAISSSCMPYMECGEVDDPNLRCGYEDGSFCRDI